MMMDLWGAKRAYDKTAQGFQVATTLQSQHISIHCSTLNNNARQDAIQPVRPLAAFPPFYELDQTSELTGTDPEQPDPLWARRLAGQSMCWVRPFCLHLVPFSSFLAHFTVLSSYNHAPREEH